MAAKKEEATKKTAPKKCATTKVVAGMDFSKAAVLVSKGKSVRRLAWEDTSAVVSCSEDGKRFQVQCGKGFAEWKACMGDAAAKDWVEA